MASRPAGPACDVQLAEASDQSHEDQPVGAVVAAALAYLASLDP